MVGGILEQSSYLFSAGVWMPSEPVIEQYDGSLTRGMFLLVRQVLHHKTLIQAKCAIFQPQENLRLNVKPQQNSPNNFEWIWKKRVLTCH